MTTYREICTEASCHQSEKFPYTHPKIILTGINNYVCHCQMGRLEGADDPLDSSLEFI